MKLEVVKRNGSTEDFQPEKIARVVKAAGLTFRQSQILGSRLAEWASEQQKTKKQTKITTIEIRDKVIEELQKVSLHAANLFTWYEKTKDSRSAPSGKAD